MINTSDSCQGAPKTESKVQKNISMLWLFGQVCFGQKIKLERMWGFIDFCEHDDNSKDSVFHLGSKLGIEYGPHINRNLY